MRIGFIGAGRVGYSLSKYLNIKHHNVRGIYSIDIEDAKDAAAFSVSEYYMNIKDLALNCDTLFLTVTDDALENLIEELKELNIHDKVLVHTSGVHTSDIFKSLKNTNACYSMHPIYAFNDKYNSYKSLDNAYFTLEGDKRYIKSLMDLFPDKVKLIDKDKKTLYHAGCVMISNLVCGLMYKSEELFKSLGLSFDMFKPLIMNNINNICDFGALNALTGPVIRNDIKTVQNHLLSLNDKEKELYISLSKVLIEMSEIKTDNDYTLMKEII